MTDALGSLRARDVMTREPVCVEPTTTMVALARILEENEISGAPVVDRQGRVVGVVSRTDLVRRCMQGDGERPPAYMFESLEEQSGEDMEEDVEPEPPVCVDEFMSGEPDTVLPDAPLLDVARLLAEARIHRVVVVDEDDFPLGIITSLDLLGRLVQEHDIRSA